MVADEEPIHEADIERLSQLHRTSLPTSVLGELGVPTLRRYYRWVCTSPNEYLFVLREAGQVAAAAVISFDSPGLLARFARSGPLRFGAACAGAALGSRRFRAHALAFAREQMDAPEGGTSPPELLQIFVDPARRSQSLGGLLLERIEALLRARGVLEYCARTPARDNDATLRFYSRRQFTPLAERQFCGVTYVELRRLVGARGPVP